MIYNFDEFMPEQYDCGKYVAWFDYRADLLLKATDHDMVSLAMLEVAGYDRETAVNVANCWSDAFGVLSCEGTADELAEFLMALAELPEQNGVGTFGNEHYEITVSEFGVTIDLGYVSVVAEGDTAVVYMDGEVVSNSI